MNKTILNIRKFLSQNILSRDAIKDILEHEIKKLDAKSILLDFSQIEFVSRSAAHELLKMKERFEYARDHKKEIIFKDLNPSVAEMVRIVAAHNAYSPKKEEEFKPKVMNIRDLVKA